MSSAPAAHPPLPPREAVDACVRRMQAEAERLAGLLGPASLAGLGEEAAAEIAQRLGIVADRARAGSWAAIARVADSGWPQQQGHLTAGAWWQCATRLSRDEAATQVRLARRLARHYARTQAAWAHGRINEDHARVIAGGIDAILARHARRIRRDHLAAGASSVELAEALARELAQTREVLETELLRLAQKWGPEALRLVLSRARLLADPDGASEEQMAKELESSLRLEQVGETAVLTAHLTLELAEKLRMILDHFRAAAFRRDAGRSETAEDDACETDPVTGDPVVVTNKAKDAGAFADWVDTTLGEGLGGKPVTERPHLDVVVTIQDLVEGTGSAVLSRTGIPVPTPAAQRVACDAHVRVVVTDGVYRDGRTGEVLDPVVGALLLGAAGLLEYGRAHRIVPTRLRRALAFRDRGCAFPGCHRPPAHTEAHHILPWQRGGDTSMANTVLLCSRHHHFVHEGGWRITLRRGMGTHQSGCWQFDPPRRRASLR